MAVFKVQIWIASSASKSRNGAGAGGFADQQTLIPLGGPQLGELAQPGDQAFEPLLSAETGA